MKKANHQSINTQNTLDIVFTLHTIFDRIERPIIAKFSYLHIGS